MVVSIAPAASAVTISYLDDLRSIHAYSESRAAIPHYFDQTVQPSPDFSDFSAGRSFPQGAASQVSSLGPAGMSASGFARGEPDVLAAGSGLSLFEVEFSIAEQASWSLSGVLARQAASLGYNSATAQLVLSSGSTVIFSQALPANPCCGAGYGNPLSLPVLGAGVLDPGQYTLSIQAAAGTSPSTPGTSSFDIVFSLPEPAPGGLLAMALAAAAAGRASLRRGLRAG
jgi:hypothetical protein